MTSRTAGLRAYTWEETFGEGWDRHARPWDPRRTAADSDTSDYSEAPSMHSSDLSDSEEDGVYEPGI